VRKVRIPVHLIFAVTDLLLPCAGSCSDFDFSNLKTSGGSAGSITNVSVKVSSLSTLTCQTRLRPD